MNAYDYPLVVLLWVTVSAVALAELAAAYIIGLFLYRSIERHRAQLGNPASTESSMREPDDDTAA